ncbi:MAG: hypothetical protein L0H10_10645 [Comamonas sp.]|uniref:hypothetical protein n=1 Tax=Comamonas sp. TaxID=34028 RepID=UPI0026495644|nr:hypothetical protein [Comamonas sp.]MDN5504260.1 hypothetical protein [Comamonas sp.]MDN5537906.1 hypothetical protein [Comamonas sp.]
MPINQPAFKFNLKQNVQITISGEQGQVRARGDGVERTNQYLVHYKSAQGMATEAWWNEDQIEAI